MWEDEFSISEFNSLIKKKKKTKNNQKTNAL